MVSLYLFKAIRFDYDTVLNRLTREIIRRREKDNLHEGIRNADFFSKLGYLSFAYFSESQKRIETLDPDLKPKTEIIMPIHEVQCLFLLKPKTLVVFPERRNDIENSLSFISDLLGVKLHPIRFTSVILLRTASSLGKEIISADFVTPSSRAVVELRGNNLLASKSFKQYLREGQITQIGFIPIIESPKLRIIRLYENGRVTVSGDFDIKYVVGFLKELLFLLSG